MRELDLGYAAPPWLHQLDQDDHISGKLLSSKAPLATPLQHQILSTDDVTTSSFSVSSHWMQIQDQGESSHPRGSAQ